MRFLLVSVERFPDRQAVGIAIGTVPLLGLALDPLVAGFQDFDFLRLAILRDVTKNGLAVGVAKERLGLAAFVFVGRLVSAMIVRTSAIAFASLTGPLYLAS